MALELREPLLTVADVAALLRLPRSTVYELVRRGELECVRLGRHIRFTRTMLEQTLERQLKEATTDDRSR